MTFRNTLAVRAALALSALGLLLGACRMRPTSVPLGGRHEEEAPTPAQAVGSAQASRAPASAALSAEDERAAEQAEEAEVSAPAVAASASGEAGKEPSKASTGAFQVKPYVAHQAWTRSSDIEFALKVGPGGNIEMKVVSHQEVRFEVLSQSAGVIDKLQIEYQVYTSTMTVMGQSRDSPEELAGKRFVITFAQGKPEVRDTSGGTPPKKQVDSVKDDAREPQEMEKALKELALLADKGRGEFSKNGAVSLAGGEDEDTKISGAHAKLLKVVGGSKNEKLAQLELGYTVTSTLDDKSSIELQVAGTQSIVDAPARYLSSTVQGLMELRSAEAAGMQGRGTVKVTTSYKF